LQAFAVGSQPSFKLGLTIIGKCATSHSSSNNSRSECAGDDDDGDGDERAKRWSTFGTLLRNGAWMADGILWESVAGAAAEVQDSKVQVQWQRRGTC